MTAGREQANAGVTANIETNVSLQPHNTLAVPAKAAFFTRAASISDLKLALGFAEQHQLPVLVLGEGSNTVLRDDFAGLVILNRLKGIELIEENDQHVSLTVAAGENWHDFVAHCLSRNWYGLENLALIPGLVGAAPIQNIGAYGVEVESAISSVSYIDIASQEQCRLRAEDCEFAYRDSIFKNQLVGKTIITSVDFVLRKTADTVLSYPALATEIEGECSPEKLFEAVCKVRSAKLPMPKDIPNAGSFFKNPIVQPQQYQDLLQRYPSMVSFEVDGGIKLAAAWLIDQLGWKQKEVEGVKVHQRQALVITNPNKCDGKSVLKLAHAIQKDVSDKFAVHLEIEPRIY